MYAVLLYCCVLLYFVLVCTGVLVTMKLDCRECCPCRLQCALEYNKDIDVVLRAYEQILLVYMYVVI